MALGSRNPFRSNLSTPNVTGTSVVTSPQVPQTDGQTNADPPATFSSSVSAPPESRTTDSRLELDDLDVGPPLEQPPPYTVRPSPMAGETTLAEGPRRPFQPAPSPQPQVTPAQTGNSFVSSGGSMGRIGRPGGLLHQLTGALNNIVENLNTPPRDSINRRYSTGSSQRPGWSGYPGQQQTQQQQTLPQAQYTPPAHPPSNHAGLEPPPRHPASHSRPFTPPSSVSASSDFARDFYAAGAGEPEADPQRATATYAPPPGPPPGRAQDSLSPMPKTLRRPSSTPSSSDFARDFYAAGAGQPGSSRGSTSYAPPEGPPPHLPPRPSTQGAGPSSRPRIPNDGRPTASPVIGHPLLKDGKILLYPKRHECDKCHNTGYKHSDPSRPCKKCWHKYAKPFTGPVAYSFSNTDPESTFQRPLTSLPTPTPAPAPAPRPPPMQYSSQTRFAPGGYMRNQYGSGFLSPPTGIHPEGVSQPPPGSVVYMAGDPRIGGRLCWNCYGKGNTSFLLFDRITCEVCGGIGRIFD